MVNRGPKATVPAWNLVAVNFDLVALNLARLNYLSRHPAGRIRSAAKSLAANLPTAVNLTAANLRNLQSLALVGQRRPRLDLDRCRFAWHRFGFGCRHLH